MDAVHVAVDAGRIVVQRGRRLSGVPLGVRRPVDRRQPDLFAQREVPVAEQAEVRAVAADDPHRALGLAVRLVAASAVQSAVGATGEIGGEVGVAVAALEDDRVVVAAGGRDVDGAGVAIAKIIGTRKKKRKQG